MAVVRPEYYKTPLEHITSIDKFFRYDEKTHTRTFIGQSLEVRAQKRYAVYDLFSISDTIKTLGILDLIIDEKYHASITLLTVLELAPREYSDITLDNIPYVSMEFGHGDLFMVNTQTVRNTGVVYAVYMEMISRGKIPYWFTYDDLIKVFDRVEEIAGTGLGADRVVYELIVAHLTRIRTRLSEMLRYHPEMADYRVIPIKSTAYAPTSTDTRMGGAYFDDGLSASLLVPSTQNSPLEDLYRGMPLSMAPDAQDSPISKDIL